MNSFTSAEVVPLRHTIRAMFGTEPVIAVSDLTRRFGARAALSSVTLRIARGGVYGLVRDQNLRCVRRVRIRRDLEGAS